MTDEEQILSLFEDGDRALMAADASEMQRIYADDYLQADENGRIWTRQQVIENLTSGKTRFVSMRSTGRRIRMLRQDLAIVHGSEDDEIEQNGRRSSVRFVYLDVVIKREDRWQIVASQLVKL